MLGSTVTTTAGACMVFQDPELGLRYRAERIGVALSLKITGLRYGNSSSSFWGRNRSGRACIASCRAVGARRRGPRGFLPQGRIG